MLKLKNDFLDNPYWGLSKNFFDKFAEKQNNETK